MGRKSPATDIKRVIQETKNAIGEDFDKILSKEVDPILDYLMKKDKMRVPLENYVIIKLVSYVETKLKSLAVWCIDKGGIVDVSNLFRGNLSVSIQKIDEIQSENFTKGGIVAATFNFQDFKDINFVFSKLFKNEFLKTIKDFVNLPESPYAIKEESQNLVDHWSEFEEMFKIRHKIAHSYLEVTHTRNLEYFKRLRFITALFVTYTFTLFILIQNLKKGRLASMPEVATFVNNKLEEYKELKIKPEDEDYNSD
jgi:hypothetical protein